MGSLTQLQKSILIGSIFGDGYLRIIKGRKNAFLEINHSLKQKKYVDWKYKILGDIVAGEPKARKNNGSRMSYRFYTKQNHELTKLFNLFYKNGKKIIPNIKLNPIILAVWFMDDGSRCRDCDVYLNTQQFDFESQTKIISLLKSLNLEARLNKDKKYQRVRFLKSSLPKLNDLISKYVIPSMEYKLSYDPVETASRKGTIAANV